LDQLVTIEIFGQPFTFKADTETSKAKEIADYFAAEVAKMEADLAENGPAVDKRVILILTALNITQELFQFKREQKDFLSILLDRSNELIKQLNMKP
jgi:cell division protein ZapA (FtsZ GTPase activity inhibitor)